MDRPLELLLVGDFSGDGGGKDRGPVVVERDDLDAVVSRFRPAVTFPGSLGTLTIESIEHLRPDSILGRVARLAALSEARQAAANPRLVQAILDEAGVLLAPAYPRSVPASAPQNEASRSGAGLLDDLLAARTSGGAGSRPGATRGRATGIDALMQTDPALGRLVDDLSRGSAIDSDATTEASIRAQIDAELTAGVAAVLQLEVFRSVESAWLGMVDLLRSACDDDLRIWLVDAGPRIWRGRSSSATDDREELSALLAHLASVLDQAGTSIDLGIVDVELMPTRDDGAAALTFAALGARLEAPVIVGVSPGWVSVAQGEGRDVERERWRVLRAMPESRWLGLSAPGRLVRVPYGPNAQEVEAFPFDERAVAGTSVAFASSALLVARAVIGCWAETHSLEAVGRFTRLEALPFHGWRRDGEPGFVGPTSASLSDADATAMRRAGLIPVISRRGSDGALLGGLEAITGAPLFSN